MKTEPIPFVSKLISAPSVKRLPSDLLYERTSFMRRISQKIPTIDELATHAEKFGTEQVVETAAELGYGIDACIRLTVLCDRVNAARFSKLHPHRAPEKVKSPEERCNLLLGIEEEEDAA